MSVKEIFSTAIEAIKISGNTELLMQIVDLKAGYFDIENQLYEAKKRIEELERILNNREKIILNEKGYYEGKESNTQYCTRCMDVDNKLVTLHDREYMSRLAKICPNCKNEIEIKKINIRRL